MSEQCDACGPVTAECPITICACCALEPEPDVNSDYRVLSNVLRQAFDQARTGKGRERHAVEGQRFEDQKIVKINEWLGSNHGAIFQACKKAIESTRLQYDKARSELLGSIVYLAAAIDHLDRAQVKSQR